MNAQSDVTAEMRKSVALIITHTIKAGEEASYESWLTGILGAVSSYPGYLGRDIFRPSHGKRTYTCIVRFDSPERLNAWVESEDRKSFVGRVSHMLEKGDVHEIRTGIDFWFTPEGVKPPKPWKQFLLAVSAVYPLSVIIPLALSPLFRFPPFAGNQYARGALIAVTLTAVLTFVVMPPYTRLVKRWLYDESN